MNKEFKKGDEVALSATFLRSLGTLSFGASGGSGPTTHDRGIGVIISFSDELPFLARVRWKNDYTTSRINIFNLVHRADIHLDAMRVEHAPRYR